MQTKKLVFLRNDSGIDLPRGGCLTVDGEALFVLLEPAAAGKAAPAAPIDLIDSIRAYGLDGEHVVKAVLPSAGAGTALPSQGRLVRQELGKRNP